MDRRLIASTKFGLSASTPSAEMVPDGWSAKGVPKHENRFGARSFNAPVCPICVIITFYCQVTGGKDDVCFRHSMKDWQGGRMQTHTHTHTHTLEIESAMNAA